MYIKKLFNCFLFILPFYLFSQETTDSLSKINNLNEVILVSKDPISEKFAVEKLEKLDIYLNPSSKGDPLNAINTIPSSTNTEEGVNISLRGSSADKSKIYLNNVPIINPVRNSQLSSLGNFSIFNTELINKMYIYSSNPPLTYGNSTGGIVEINTNSSLESNNIIISTALSNTGLMLNKKINTKSFFQLYGNYQFSDFFRLLNKKSTINLNDFHSGDIGGVLNIEVSKNINFTLYNYYINESFSSFDNILNYSGNSTASQKRFFSISNLDINFNKSKLKFSFLYDISDKKYNFSQNNIFNIINSNSKNNNIYASVFHKLIIDKKLNIQYGLDVNIFKTSFSNNKNIYYNDLSEDTNRLNSYETYFFTEYKPSKRFIISGGLRQNLLNNYLSYQISNVYNFNSKNKLIIGMGTYNSYYLPNNNQSYLLNKSNHIAADYFLKKRKFSLTSSIYLKKDKGLLNNDIYNSINFSEIRTFGFETSFNYIYNKYFSLYISNMFLNQKGFADNQKFNTSYNLKYFIKSNILYSNPKLFSSSISITTRPGNYYTPVNNYIEQDNNIKPIFGTLFSKKYKNYLSLDFSLNKAFTLKNINLITFFSVNNLLNKNNEKNIYYNSNFSNTYYNMYQKRIFYFGIQYRISRL